MHPKDTDRRKYPAIWKALNLELREIEQLDGNRVNVVKRLSERQLEMGFIKDDLHAVQRYTFPDPERPDRFFTAQYNPARVQRLKSRVSSQPPQRNDAVNNNCVLCPRNFEWQHMGAELGYEIDVNGKPFNILMNAYPLMPLHVVISTKHHIPQAWDLGHASEQQFSIDEIIANLATLAEQLPGYVGFYNGEGAGVSIPEHFHYQFFNRRNGGDLFPLELAPARQVADLLSVIDDYPVDAVRWEGSDTGEVISRASCWINEWLKTRIGTRPTLSANIFAMADTSGKHLQVYFVPRDKELSHSPDISGMIASLEILGELVLTTDDEKRSLDESKIDYPLIANILSHIRVPL